MNVYNFLNDEFLRNIFKEEHSLYCHTITLVTTNSLK